MLEEGLHLRYGYQRNDNYYRAQQLQNKNVPARHELITESIKKFLDQYVIQYDN
jgi:hypothetical protein